jgi:cation transport regulator ChaB
MPYSSNKELPKSVISSLPESAQSIFRSVFNSSSKKNNEETSFKIAWGAVKKAGYKKNDSGKWVKESLMDSANWIREHCTYCAEDLFSVAQALLSVEDQLDYQLKYELEYILQQYVIEKARLDPNGLASILEKFPMEEIAGDNTPEIEESLTSYSVELFDRVKSISEINLTPFDNLIKNSYLMEAHKEDDKKKSKLKSVYASLPEWAIDKNEVVMESESEEIQESIKEEFRESATVLREADSSGDVWRVKLIQQGMTLSGRYFEDKVLREAIPLFEGARAYLNHPDHDYKGGDRPVQTLVGWYDNIELKEGDGLYADWHILSNSGTPWLKNQILELSEKGKLNLIGLSLLGLGKSSIKKVDGQPVKYAEAITSVRSVDLVDVPGAGGKIDSMKLSLEENLMLENLTLEDLKESNPELYAAIMEQAKNEQKPVVDPEPIIQESLNNDILTRLEIREKNMILNDHIRESNLPTPMRVALQEQFGDTNFDVNVLDKQIKVYRESAAEITPVGNPLMHLPSQIYMISEQDKIQASMDKLFGLEVDEKFANVPKFRGIQEAYVGITGDYEFSWGAIPLDDRFRFGAGDEPVDTRVTGGGTVTFANVLGTSMNRRLVRQYKRQPMWWEPICTIVELANLKQQDRNRMQSLGALTERTTGGAEYVSMTWAENVETYTPTEYGNILTIAQRAIVNDDLRALVRGTDELARSAGITLNEYVSNLFTQNSGDGPALTDTFKVFDATNHQGNRITASLSRTSFGTADQVVRKFTDNSSKRIGLFPEYLLIPHDLREMALQIQSSEKIPDSANHADNIYQNTFVVIEVPQFTDTNNWYLMSGPGQVDMLEMGFLNGRREPEMFVQANPDQGMMFTHDVLAYKIRHRYGGDWLDFRGAVGSIVG